MKTKEIRILIPAQEVEFKLTKLTAYQSAKASYEAELEKYGEESLALENELLKMRSDFSAKSDIDVQKAAARMKAVRSQQETLDDAHIMTTGAMRLRLKRAAEELIADMAGQRDKASKALTETASLTNQLHVFKQEATRTMRINQHDIKYAYGQAIVQHMTSVFDDAGCPEERISFML